MRHQHDGPSGRTELTDHLEALGLEGVVADREDLVDEEDLRVELRHDGEAEARDHSRRIEPDRHVDIVLQLGEGDDGGQAAPNLGTAESQHHPIELELTPSRKVRMEAVYEN